MIEFFITRCARGFRLETEGAAIDTFASEAAADMAIRFAQDTGAEAYRIFYP